MTTQVQLLQLKGIGRLENAAFGDIWQKSKEVLGEDLVQVDERSIDPRASETFGLRRDSKANYVVGIALFREPTGNDWRAIARLPLPPPEKCTPQPAEVMPAPSKDDTQLKFFLERYRIENRTPPLKRASGPTLGDRGGKA